MTDTHQRDAQPPLNDDDLRELFLELSEALPSEQLTAEDRANIRKLTTDADGEHDLNRMPDHVKETH